jgi:molybdopterin synthase catalytic subunit
MDAVEQASSSMTDVAAQTTAAVDSSAISESTKTQPEATASTSAKTLPSMLDPTNFPQHLASSNVHIELRYTPLDTPAALCFTRSPSCGANVLFLGTTRNNFDNRPVTRLSYSAYPALALKSLFAIAEDVRVKHGLEKVYIAHRLGEVDVEEESIAVSVSSAHRGAGWRGAEELLERVKQRAEIWKREWFADTGEGDWRANKDRDGEGKIVENAGKEEKGKETVGGQEQETGQSAGTEGVGSDAQVASVPAAQSSGNVDGEGAAVTPLRATATHQTSKELDSDIADYIAQMTAKLRM